MSFTDKFKRVNPLDSVMSYTLDLAVTRKDYEYLTMVATRYHVTVSELLRVIFDTGLKVMADESGLVRR